MIITELTKDKAIITRDARVTIRGNLARLIKPSGEQGVDWFIDYSAVSPEDNKLVIAYVFKWTHRRQEAIEAANRFSALCETHFDNNSYYRK